MLECSIIGVRNDNYLLVKRASSFVAEVSLGKPLLSSRSQVAPASKVKAWGGIMGGFRF